MALALALLLPMVSTSATEGWRHILLAGCGAILAGIAFDLVRFVRSYLRRGHCAITVGLRGGDVYRIAGVPEPALAQFVERARASGAQPTRKGERRLES